MDYDRQTTILQARMNDLALAQYRMTAQFAALAGEYSRVLAGYLGEHPATTSARQRQAAGQSA